MLFNPDNKIVQLCAKGIESEATQPDKAKALFMQAWSEAANDVEKLTAAHYVARHQETTEDKLQWDKTALQFALKINEDNIMPVYSSLYLNIAKDYEDLNMNDNALKYYKIAEQWQNNLPDNGYGKMIRAGIADGLKRISV